MDNTGLVILGVENGMAWDIQDIVIQTPMRWIPCLNMCERVAKTRHPMPGASCVSCDFAHLEEELLLFLNQ